MGPKNRNAGATAQTPSPLNDKGQYHHIVPRFILKRFIIEDQQPKKPQRGRRGKKNTSAINDPIYCYSVSDGTLSINSANNTYGVTDLYKDIKNQENVYQVEQKLSVLESHAAKAISELHKLVEKRDSEREKGNAQSGPTVFKIKRKFLNYLRKFMFIMYYRKDRCKDTHFQEDHPENAGGAAWIRNFRRKNNLDPSEVWLHVLEYYLDTPHSDLVEQGQKVLQKLGLEGLNNISRGIDPNLDHVETLQYQGEASNYFLAIWEAAEGEEFIITNISFGLCEWIKMGNEIINFHRFYVISPRIALVLCTLPLRPDHPFVPEFDTVYRQSILWGMPHKAPRVSKDGNEVHRIEGRMHDFEEDTMEYELSTLSVAQTHKINAIILGNISSTGIATFRTPSAMLKTLKHFSKDQDFGNQEQYRPLFTQLLEKTGESSEFTFTSNPNPISNTHLSTAASELKTDFYGVTLMIYTKLQESNGPEIQIVKDMESRIHRQAALKIGQTPYDINPRRAQLVRNMEDRDAYVVFYRTKIFLEEFLKIKLPKAFTECMILSFLDWTLKNRRLMFQIIETRMPVRLMEWVFDEPE